MATQKTALKRFNGTSWDEIHLASSADIVALGKAVTVSGNVGDYTDGTAIPATATVADVVAKLAKGTTATNQQLDAAATFAAMFAVTGEEGAKKITFDGKTLATTGDIPSTVYVTALAAENTGDTIAKNLLPAGAFNKLIVVANEDERMELTEAQMNTGDIVKVTGGNMYYVKDAAAAGTAAAFEVFVASSAASVAWADVTDKPATLSGYGITDALANSLLKTTYTQNAVVGWSAGGQGADAYEIDATVKKAVNANKAADADKLGGHEGSYYAVAQDLTNLSDTVGDANNGLVKQVNDLDTAVQNIETAIGAAPNPAGETEAQKAGSGMLKALADLKAGKLDALDVSLLTGGDENHKISIDLLPAAAIERLYIAADDEARLALTTAAVQNGDTVKVQGTGKMYYVVDDTKLGGANAAEAFEEYTVGSASSVPFSGVTGKPANLAGYGITDAVNKNDDVVAEASVANAGKLLAIGEDGKLHADLDGKVAWANITDKPTSTVAQIDAAVATATHTNRAVLDKFTEGEGDLAGKLLYNGAVVAMASDVTAVQNSVNALANAPLEIVADATALTDVANGRMVLETIA